MFSRIASRKTMPPARRALRRIWESMLRLRSSICAANCLKPFIKSITIRLDRDLQTLFPTDGRESYDLVRLAVHDDSPRRIYMTPTDPERTALNRSVLGCLEPLGTP